MRDGKNIEARTPKKLKKAIDPVTGEVRIGSTSVHRADYSRATPNLLEILDPALAELFPAQAAIKKLLDTNTMLVGRPNPPSPSCEWDTTSFVYSTDPSMVGVDCGGFANVLAVAVLCVQVKF